MKEGVMKSLVILLTRTLAACASAPPMQPPLPLTAEGAISHAGVTAAVRSICAAGDGSRDPDSPFICIDPNANPQVKIKSLRVNDRVNGTTHPVLIQWFTKSASSALKVTVPSGSACFDGQPRCFPGGGHCRVLTKPVAAEQSCSYDVWVDGVAVDPIIIVQPCCAGMDLAPVEGTTLP
jgi:hypothetical protein